MAAAASAAARRRRLSTGLGCAASRGLRGCTWAVRGLRVGLPAARGPRVVVVVVVLVFVLIFVLVFVLVLPSDMCASLACNCSTTALHPRAAGADRAIDVSPSAAGRSASDSRSPAMASALDRGGAASGQSFLADGEFAVCGGCAARGGVANARRGCCARAG